MDVSASDMELTLMEEEMVYFVGPSQWARRSHSPAFNRWTVGRSVAGGTPVLPCSLFRVVLR